jgi:hypothetical protein
VELNQRRGRASLALNTHLNQRTLSLSVQRVRAIPKTGEVPLTEKKSAFSFPSVPCKASTHSCRGVYCHPHSPAFLCLCVCRCCPLFCAPFLLFFFLRALWRSGSWPPWFAPPYMYAIRCTRRRKKNRKRFVLRRLPGSQLPNERVSTPNNSDRSSRESSASPLKTASYSAKGRAPHNWCDGNSTMCAV